MAVYLTGRIEEGKLNYNAVITKYSQFKDDIDKTLAADGFKVNTDGTVTNK